MMLGTGPIFWIAVGLLVLGLLLLSNVGSRWRGLLGAGLAMLLAYGLVMR